MKINCVTTEGLLRVNWSIERRYSWERGPPVQSRSCSILRRVACWSLQSEVLHSTA